MLRIKRPPVGLAGKLEEGMSAQVTAFMVHSVETHGPRATHWKVFQSTSTTLCMTKRIRRSNCSPGTQRSLRDE
ncbi:hypothetical protein TNCV_1903151 [Trichonephila clavipes]|nr:hypothetical protein TNCV_1903151 [Trichonephila clavipes]